MTKFVVGKEYSCRSFCNYDCIFTIKITKRTEKTLWFEENGRERKTKIHVENDSEWIVPERYSMAPVYRADKEM